MFRSVEGVRLIDHFAESETIHRDAKEPVLKKILTNLITVLLFATAPVALSELSPMERKEEYLKLWDIKDPAQRIAAEMRFAYLGIENPEAKRLENLGVLQGRAEESPDEKWLFTFVFSDGLSADEVADIIDTFVLNPVRSIDAKLVKLDGFVLSVGLGDFDLWSGSSREILSYQMEQMRERGRFDGVLSKNERLIEDAFADQDLAQFYIIQGVTTAGNAEALRSTRASSIVRIDMFKDHESRMRATPPSMKLPLPSYEDQKSTRQILRMPSSPRC